MITAKNLRKPFRSSSSITFTKQTAPLTEMLVKGAINVEKDLFSMLCLLIFLLLLKNKRKSGQTPLYKKRGWDRGAKLLEIRRNTRKLLLKFWGISTCFRRSCFCSHALVLAVFVRRIEKIILLYRLLLFHQQHQLVRFQLQQMHQYQVSRYESLPDRTLRKYLHSR